MAWATTGGPNGLPAGSALSTSRDNPLAFGAHAPLPGGPPSLAIYGPPRPPPAPVDFSRTAGKSSGLNLGDPPPRAIPRLSYDRPDYRIVKSNNSLPGRESAKDLIYAAPPGESARGGMRLTPEDMDRPWGYVNMQQQRQQHGSQHLHVPSLPVQAAERPALGPGAPPPDASDEEMWAARQEALMRAGEGQDMAGDAHAAHDSDGAQAEAEARDGDEREGLRVPVPADGAHRAAQTDAQAMSIFKPQQNIMPLGLTTIFPGMNRGPGGQQSFARKSTITKDGVTLHRRY